MSDFLILDNKTNINGEITTEMKESDGDLLVKQSSGENTNTDNFIIKKANGNKIYFTFFKLNGIYYVNINNQHIIDYKKFINIQYITNITNNSVKIKNNSIGEIIIPDCDLDIIYKTLEVMNIYMKKRTYWFSELLYIISH